MNLLVTTDSNNGTTLDTARHAAQLHYVRFRELRLKQGESFKDNAGSHELCLVLLSGIATISVDGQTFEAVGERMSVFDRVPPHAVYVPNAMDYVVTALTNLELGICGAPGRGTQRPRHIRPADVRRSIRGEGVNLRYIHDILPETTPADSLLVVEVYTPAGHWSSFPPHKHDTDAPPHESQLEEIYYHRLNPPTGFGFQRVYTDDRSLDEAIAFGDRNCVKVPRGYHPVGAPYGHDLYYLNVMAGPKREWKFTTDPDFAWLVKPAP